MPCGSRGASRVGVVLSSVLAGCALAAPLDGLTGGVAGRDAVGDAAPDDGGSSSFDGPALTAPDAPADGQGEASAPPEQEASDGPDTGAAGDAGSFTGDDGAVDAPPPPPPALAFVQVAVATTSGTAHSLGAKYAMAQAQGDLNVVAIGYNDSTSSVTSVHDTSGNAYSLAIGPTRLAPDLTQYIYYAPNIRACAAGANTVIVSFDAGANSVDLRVLEYAGLSTTSPLDVVAARAGSATGDVSSGTASTTGGRELIVGAGMTTDIFTNAGGSFTQRAITTLGDMVEDQIVSTEGTYGADAPVSQTAEYVMQMAAFR